MREERKGCWERLGERDARNSSVEKKGDKVLGRGGFVLRKNVWNEDSEWQRKKGNL